MTNDEFTIGCLAGCTLGLGLGLVGMLGIYSYIGPNVNKAKIFKEENKPAAMRVYIEDSCDKILVEGVEEYIPLSVHLGSRELADRDLEEERIKKLVRWYEE